MELPPAIPCVARWNRGQRKKEGGGVISRIRGIVDQFSENTLIVNVGGVSYEVYIPTAVMKSFDGKLAKDAPVALVTYHYYQTDPSKSIPILIGFSNNIEKEFFEKCSEKELY